MQPPLELLMAALDGQGFQTLLMTGYGALPTLGESMDRDSLLPPALSESLHIPPPWLAEAQGRNEA
ncbi:hypothetical protein EYF80_024641 [Liparis tanakae]|uniref:Uncharacterized protein n=1 Tax=Liparis tanakae TaxID=230148 RepID=A0A4Z2HJU8_9TELE|nr:hypothetical protein EYF80_024641 [Liparis tanakae]